MNKLVIISLLCLLISGCAHTDKVTVPGDCDVLPQNTDQAVTIICPHRISVKR